jgi:hypothetical protein
MATGDVNGDGHPDIYVSRRTTGNAGHLMLVNGGDGSAFVSMTIPEPGADKPTTFCRSTTTATAGPTS